MADFKYTFNLDTTASGDGAEQTKAGIDAVTRSTNQAAESQIAASAKLVAANEEVTSSIKEKAQASQDAAKFDEETAKNIDLLEAGLMKIALAQQRYSDALDSGDKDGALEAINDQRNALEDLGQIQEATPAQLKVIADELGKVEKKVKSGQAFEKLSEQADKANKSLSKIEKLQVAEAIGDIVQQARSAGKSLSDLGQDGESTTDSVLNAAGAVGDLASGVAAGFAAGGPIGAGIALVTAGLSFFSEQAKKTRAEINEALGGKIELDFSQTEQSIKDTETAARLYADQIDRANAALISQQNRLENIRQLELQKARDKAEIEGKKLELDKLDVLQSDLKEPEKAEALAEIAKKEIKIQADLKKQEIDSEIAKDRKEIESLRAEIIKLEKKVDEKAESLFANDPANKAKASQSQATRQGNRFEFAASEIPELLADSVENPFYDAKHQDDLEKYVKEVKELSSKDDPKQRAQIYQRMLQILESAPKGDLDSDDIELQKGLKEALKEYSEFQKINTPASHDKKDSDTFYKELEKDRRNLKNAKKSLDDRDENIEGRIASNEEKLKNLETNTELDFKLVDKRKDGKLQTFEKKKKEVADDKARKESENLEREQGLANNNVDGALGALSGVGGLKSEFKRRISEGQNNNQDGSDPDERKELLAMLDAVLASGQKRGNLDTSIIGALRSHRAKIAAQDAKILKMQTALNNETNKNKNNRGK